MSKILNFSNQNNDKKANLFKHHRLKRAQSIAEFGPALWLMFIGILFPMLSLGTVVIRYSIFHTTAYMALRNAVQSRTFLNNTNNGSGVTILSALNAARQTANNFQHGFTGINFNAYSNNLQLYIVMVTQSSPGVYNETIYAANAPLTVASNQQAIYNLKIVLNGTINPIVQLPNNLFGNIPGLTAPLPLVATNQMIFDNSVTGLMN